MSEIETKQKIEIEFWRDSEHDSPETDSIHNIVNKVTDAAVFLDCINRHHKELVTKGRVLELGGGARLGFLCMQEVVSQRICHCN